MNFLGTTTPQDLLAVVASGVQTTGGSLWPLIVLVGIPLAFVIGGMVVSFIRHSVGKTNNLATDEATIAHDSWLARVRHDLDTTGHSTL